MSAALFGLEVANIIVLGSCTTRHKERVSLQRGCSLVTAKYLPVSDPDSSIAIIK